MAVQLGRSVVHKLKGLNSNNDKEALAQWLCMLGGWLAETKVEPSSVVMKMMMEAAQAVMDENVEVQSTAGPIACKVLYRYEVSPCANDLFLLQ